MRAVYIILTVAVVAAIIVLSIKKPKPELVSPATNIDSPFVGNFYLARVIDTGDTVMVRDETGKKLKFGDTVWIRTVNGQNWRRGDIEADTIKDNMGIEGRVIVSSRWAIILPKK